MQSDRRATDITTAPEAGDLTDMETAILQTVAYSDIFDYPLTGVEIHRYLIGIRASWRSVQEVLDHPMPASGRLVSSCGYFTMPGRDGIVQTRRRRSAVASAMWPRAIRYGDAIGRLPFVRMVAVTGALAMDNVEPETDIDYLVVTEPGRVWLCRALVVGLVKLAGRRGDVICPNYFLSERSLELGKPDLFTAHELAQMVPLVGVENYRRMCRLNSWAAGFLPNAFDTPRSAGFSCENGAGRDLPQSEPEGTNGHARPLIWSAAEAALRSPLGTPLERWEMSRKARKLTLQACASERDGGPSKAEIGFSADQCKGHFDSHQQQTMDAYFQRLSALKVAYPSVGASGRAMRGIA